MTTEYFETIKKNVNLPAMDVMKIGVECWRKGYSVDRAIIEAKKLYISDEYTEVCEEMESITGGVFG